MFVITGSTGQTGSVVAKMLLAAGHPVRAIVRRPDQAATWQAIGAETAVSDLGDPASLRRPFSGATGAYLMNPPAYGHADLFERARAVHAAMIDAAHDAGIEHVVALSSVGAQHATGTGNIATAHDFERQLASSGLSFTILRAANFIENWAWSLSDVVRSGQLPSMFHPLDRALPMVAARDIGDTAALLLLERPGGIVELQGPQTYSPDDAALALSKLLGKSVEAVETPRQEWGNVFASNGFQERTVVAFCEMFDGFNNGRISFEGIHTARRGKVELIDALDALLARLR